MRFRPCVDIHNGKVKQIVGGSLKDEKDFAEENFVSELDGAYYGELYKSRSLKGGHIIILNPAGSEYYDADCEQAFSAMSAYPNGFQIGGGINGENAYRFLEKGASHVIVTSYVFKDGQLHYDRLERLVKAVGRERLVLDLSCRKKDGKYFIVTDRWQKFTDVELTTAAIHELEGSCAEFLIHAVDSEGKQHGIERELVSLMAESCTIPATYAGGISKMTELEVIKQLGKGKIDFTVGSALDIFGGDLLFEDVAAFGRD
ncbi:MAG: phosphoribosylformimino-5-aminoimidazole carboxamide ribotide isomerase [Ruminococcus sp.]|nr:phosphoribosylformimino-5-aminoimidazole carboxamide ribotide isomerase [Ruminococcus sp.]